MKRKLAAALLVMGLLASSVAPANAIFGLSKCEKVKKQITNEEKVGLLLYKKYSTQRQIVLAMDNPTWNDLNSAHSYLPDFIDSDLRIFSLVDKNSSCFTTQQIAKARRETSYAKKNIADISFMRDYILKNPRLGKKVLGVESVELLRNLYPNYYSYFNNKKLG